MYIGSEINEIFTCLLISMVKIKNLNLKKSINYL